MTLRAETGGLMSHVWKSNIVGNTDGSGIANLILRVGS